MRIATMITGMVMGKWQKAGAKTDSANQSPKLENGQPPQRFRGPVYRYAVTSLIMVALGVIWAMGMVGCTSYVGPGRMGETSGAFFPNARQSSLEISRLLRNAHYYKLMGRPELALKELEQAYQQNPDNLKLVDTLAQSYEELGQFEAARKIYQEALTSHGSHPALANNLCFTYYLQGAWQEAETCYRQTLARDPGNETARNNLGLLYCRLGRQNEARRLWQEAEGPAAAEYKARQALAALGMADRAVFAQKAESAPNSVAAVTPSVPLAPQKIAMQLPSPPAPDLGEPVNELQEQAALSEASPVPSAVVREESGRAAPDRLPLPASPLKEALAPTAVEDVYPPPVSAPGPASAPAHQQVVKQLPPQPAPEKPVSDDIRVSNQAKLPTPEQASPATTASPAPSSRLAPLTCTELVDTDIEVRNGTPTPNLAREVRYLLELNAFTVAKIGNHIDFGAKKTVIYYRPVAQRVAKTLKAGFFPMAGLEQTDQLKASVDIKVLLGHDLQENPDLMARLGKKEGKPATASPASAPADKRLATPTPAADLALNQQDPRPLPEKAALNPPLTSVSQVQAPHPAKPLTTAELRGSAIEIRNGNGTPDMARQTRVLLNLEGFTVAKIGNHVDFGARQTMIYYRPEGERVARALGLSLFPEAGLQPSKKLHKNIAVEILLGADLQRSTQLIARLAAEGQ